MSVKEYMSTKVNLGDNWDDWNRYNPLRQELERIRIEKFSETSWLRVYNTWKKQLDKHFHDNSETSQLDDWLMKTEMGKKFVRHVNKWISNNKKYIFDI